MESRNNTSSFFKEFRDQVSQENNNNYRPEFNQRGMKSNEILKNKNTEEGFNKIEIVEKYGISYAELADLNFWQTQALVNFYKKGLRALHLRIIKPFDSLYHLQALNYLHFYEARSWVESLAILDGANEAEAFGLSLGYSYEDVKDLKLEQIRLLQKFSHIGLTSSLLRKHPWLEHDKYFKTLDILLTQYGFAIDAAINEMMDLNEDELFGIMHRLERVDVEGLNKFQIAALIAHQTADNGLSGENFINKSWFNSDAHVKALGHLLTVSNLSVKETFNELHELTDFQALEICNGKMRQDVFDLTKMQLKILNEMKSYGLTATHLRGKDWFNSGWHRSVLIYLIDEKKSSLSAALELIDGLNENQCFLMQNGGLARNELLALNSYQAELLRKFYFSKDEKLAIMSAKTLLDTESKYRHYIEMYNIHHSHTKTLKILEHSQNKQPPQPGEDGTSCFVM